MDSKNKIIKTNHSLEMLIAESIELDPICKADYCKTGKFGAVNDLLFTWEVDC